jgi:hypothetical protein
MWGSHQGGPRRQEQTMPQFFLTLPHDSAEEPTMATMDPAELEEVFAAVNRFNTDLQESGAWVFAGGLHPPSSATTVDHTGETAVHTPGPFVEAAAYVGGFWVVDAADEAAAIVWAEQASRALQSRVEVRALQEAPAE